MSSVYVKDKRIKDAIQEKSCKSKAVGTQDYVAYSAGRKYNEGEPHLWKILKNKRRGRPNMRMRLFS